MRQLADEARSTAQAIRQRRRAARLAENRTDILDAAERVFADRGLVEGSLRDIARQSGFSTAAIYNYFLNKEQLFAETLSRRGVEWLAVLEEASTRAGDPMDRLHTIVDAAIDFYEAHPDFRRMLGHVRGTVNELPSVVVQYAGDRVEEFTRSVALLRGIVEDGQAAGEIRPGAPSALLHFYMTLVFEHVFLAAPDAPGVSLTRDEFHGLVDGALRRTTP
jgi:AcrR family transcriptional regulator